MTQLGHSRRRKRRRVARHMIHKDLFTLDLTQEAILAELDPNWFQGEEDDVRAPAERVRTDEAAA